MATADSRSRGREWRRLEADWSSGSIPGVRPHVTRRYDEVTDRFHYYVDAHDIGYVGTDVDYPGL
eukprot:1879795-Lingulodinium_polyedra.AAC.1